MKVVCALFLAALAGTAVAICPNSCSGHGTCNKFDTCECFDEDKTGYYGYLYDTKKGYERIFYDGIRELTNAAGDVTTNGGAKTLGADGFSVTQATAYGNIPDMLTLDQSKRKLSKQAFVGKQYTGADCSLMTCPKGVSWSQPWWTDPNRFSSSHGTSTKGHSGLTTEGEFKDTKLSHSVCTHKDFVECSDGGLCDRGSGTCQCFPQYTGTACERTVCPGDCNGHGVCMSNIELSEKASLKRAFTASAFTSGVQSSDFGMKPDPQQVDPTKMYLKAWDSGAHYGCKCDIGFRGEDCSQIECPSGSDPLGWKGNSQGEDCSGRGICDYGSGTCTCFAGFTGQDCSTVESLV